MHKEMSGLDTQFAAASAIYPSLCNDTRPSRTLSNLVQQGRFGIKSGKGFWTWNGNTAAAEETRYRRQLQAAVKVMNSDPVPADPSLS